MELIACNELIACDELFKVFPLYFALYLLCIYCLFFYLNAVYMRCNSM